MNNLIHPKEAASILGISVATITRCRKLGAPVHAWGSTGRRYRIDVQEFIAWMEAQGENRQKAPPVNFCSSMATVEELAQRRRAMMRAL